MSGEISGLTVTKQPGDTLSVTVTIQNTGSVSDCLFKVGVSIGKANYEDGISTSGEWHDEDIYNDGLGRWGLAVLDSGETGTVTRTFHLDPNRNPENWNDVWARVLDNDENELDSAFLYNEFSVIPDLPDNTENFSNIEESDFSQGKCLPGVSFDATDQEKRDAFLTSDVPPNVRHPTRIISYDDYGNREEVMITMLRLYSYGKALDTIIRFQWFRESDGVKVYEFEYTIPPGPDGGWHVYSWIGKASWEINGKGIYRCHVESEVAGNIKATAEMYFQLI